MSNADEAAKHSEKPPIAVAEDTNPATDPQITIATTNQDSSPTATAAATLSPTAHSNEIDGKNPFADTTATTTSLNHESQEEEVTPPLPPRPEPTHALPAETMAATNVHFADQLPPSTLRATETPQPTQTNPSISQLKGMFPDFDDAIMYASFQTSVI